VTKTVTTNGTAAAPVAVVATAVNAAGTAVTLTVPAVPASTTAQSVAYSVTYQSGVAVNASAYTVKAASATAKATSSTTVQVTLLAVPTTALTTASFMFSGGAISNVTKVDDLNYTLTVPMMTSGSSYTVSGPNTGSLSLTYTAVTGGLNVSFTALPAMSVAQTQALVNIGTLTLTAGSADAQVYGLNIHRSGLSADSDVSSITVWDGTTKLNVPGVLSNGLANITFSSPLTIAAGTTKTLAVDLNVDPKANTGAQLNFSLVDASAIKTASTVSGTFPMVTNTYTVATVTNLGYLTVLESADAPSASYAPTSGNTVGEGIALSAGTLGVTLGKYDLKAYNEEMKVSQLTLTQLGSVADTDIQNLKLMLNGTQVGTTVNAVNKKATFVFTTPLDIKSGTFISLQLVGDITAGASRSTEFDLDDVNDVRAVGQTYGTTIVAQNALNSASGSISLYIAKGTLLAARDASSIAAGNISATVTDQNFATLDVTATGEPVQITKLHLMAKTVAYNASTSPSALNLTNLKVTAGNVVVGQQQNPTFDSSTGEYTLSLGTPLTVTPGTPAVMTISADLNVGSSYAKDTYQLGLANDSTEAIEGTGTISGQTVDYGSNGILGNILTVGSIVVTDVVQPGMDGNTVFANQNSATIDAFQFTHNAAETATLYKLDITDDTSKGTPSTAELTNARLVDSTGKIVSNTISTWNSRDESFTLLNPIDVAQGQTLTLTLVSDIANSLNGASAKPSTDLHYIGIDGSKSVMKYKSSGNIMNFTTNNPSSLAVTGSAATPKLTVTNSAQAQLDGEYNIVDSGKDVLVAAYNFANAGSSQDAVINKVYLTPDLTGSADTNMFKNIRIVSAADHTKIYGSIANFNDGTSEVYVSTTGLTIPSSSNIAKSVEVAVLADVDSGATSGDVGKVKISKLDYNGASTGSSYTNAINDGSGSIADLTAMGIKDTPYFEVVPSVVNVTAVPLPNTSLDFTSANGAEIGRYTIKNAGANTVYLSQLKFKDIDNSLPKAFGLTPSNTSGQAITVERSSDGTVLGSTTIGTDVENAVTLATTGFSHNILAPGASLTVSVILSNVGTSVIGGDRMKLRLDDGYYNTTGSTAATYEIDSEDTANEVVFTIPNGTQNVKRGPAGN
jgi:hypothetical protein